MRFHYLQHAALVAMITTTATVQAAVPTDLTAGFSTSGTDIQVAYTGLAVNGFKDGSKFTKDAVAKQPTFALGDSSSIVPAARYTVIMLDTTSDDARVMHFAQPNFKITDIVNIASDSEAVLAYKAPGAFKETGERQYTFLLFQHFADKELDSLKLPDEGAVFTVRQFQDDNGLEDPVAGRSMVVDLGAGGGEEQETTSSQAQEQVSSTADAASSVKSSAVGSRVSSAKVASTTGSAQTAETTGGTSATLKTTARSTGLAVASSVVERPSTSTIFLASSATGSATGSGAAAQQTGTGASGVALGVTSCVVGAAMAVFAGLLAW